MALLTSERNSYSCAFRMRRMFGPIKICRTRDSISWTDMLCVYWNEISFCWQEAKWLAARNGEMPRNFPDGTYSVLSSFPPSWPLLSSPHHKWRAHTRGSEPGWLRAVSESSFLSNEQKKGPDEQKRVQIDWLAIFPCVKWMVYFWVDLVWTAYSVLNIR